MATSSAQVVSKKVEAIQNASPPQNASDVKSLLGMTQYVSRVIPNYTSITFFNETGYTLEMGAGRTESSRTIERGPGRRRSHVTLRSTKAD